MPIWCTRFGSLNEDRGPWREASADSVLERMTTISPSFREAGAGPGVVCLHANASSSSQWRGLMDMLAPSYRVFAADSYGAGKSPPYVDGVIRLGHEVALLEPVFARAGRPFSLVGHSYGAAVVGLAATMQPERFTAVVLAEPGYRKLLPQIQADQAQYSQNQIHSMMRRAFNKQHNLESALHIYAEWVRTGSWDQMDAVSKQSLMDNGKAMIAYTAHGEAPEFTCETAKRITMPMLVVYGEESPPNNRIISGTLAECAANAKRGVIPTAMHAMHRQNPEAFNKAVLEFLAAAK